MTAAGVVGTVIGVGFRQVVAAIARRIDRAGAIGYVDASEAAGSLIPAFLCLTPPDVRRIGGTAAFPGAAFRAA